MADTDKRPALSREQIVATAVALADANGLEAITMRKVADELGYKVMSLYNHVSNKDDLLEAMVDAALADVDPAQHESWRADITAVATELNRALNQHHWVSQLWTATFPGPHRLRLGERLLEDFARRGLPDAQADLGFHLTVNHTVGFSHLQAGYGRSTVTESAGRVRAAEDIKPEDYPNMAAHGRFHAEDDRVERPDEFRYVLDLILDSVSEGQAHGRRGACRN